MVEEKADGSALLPASIESSPRQVIEKPEMFDLIPKGSRIYITDLGNCSEEMIVQAAKKVGDKGCVAVPHFPARRFPSVAAFESRIKFLASEAGIQEVLAIAGEADSPGPLDSSLTMLQTGMFDELGIGQIAIAGHPEGAPEIPNEVIREFLMQKLEFSRNSNADFRIVTQFGFDAERIIAWLDELRDWGVDLPVHVGIAGPAKVSTLLKFATISGIGNSVNFLKKRSGAMMTMLSGYEPDKLVSRLENHVHTHPNCKLENLHIYPFGGIVKSAQWLNDRGTWNCNSNQDSTSNQYEVMQ